MDRVDGARMLRIYFVPSLLAIYTLDIIIIIIRTRSWKGRGKKERRIASLRACMLKTRPHIFQPASQPFIHSSQGLSEGGREIP